MPFGEFKFGPLFMRLCYELGLEELAATTLTDPVGENEQLHIVQKQFCLLDDHVVVDGL